MRVTDLSDTVGTRLMLIRRPMVPIGESCRRAPSRGQIGMGGPDVGRRVAEAERTLARLTEEFRHSGSAFALTRVLERQEAVSSSSIEGTQSTLDALLELEEDGAAGDEAIETRGVSLALDHGLGLVLEHGPDAFTTDMIIGLHARLAKTIQGLRGPLEPSGRRWSGSAGRAGTRRHRYGIHRRPERCLDASRTR